MEVRFRDGVGRLAQLPGANFYRRIREKFGRAALTNVRCAMERKWWTLLAVCVATFMLLLDVTIVNVALPDIQRDLDASFSSLQWVVDAYALTLASFLLVAGSLGDRLGRRRVFTLRLRALHRRLVRLRPRRRPDRAQLRPRLPGSRRRRRCSRPRWR